MQWQSLAQIALNETGQIPGGQASPCLCSIICCSGGTPLNSSCGGATVGEKHAYLSSLGASQKQLLGHYGKDLHIFTEGFCEEPLRNKCFLVLSEFPSLNCALQGEAS